MPAKLILLSILSLTVLLGCKETDKERLTRLVAEWQGKEIVFPENPVFTAKNTGTQPLVIIDVATTCGCASPNFEKHPANPGETLNVTVEMQPKDAGFFNETITVKCNTDKQIKLTIRGQAI